MTRASIALPFIMATGIALLPIDRACAQDHRHNAASWYVDAAKTIESISDAQWAALRSYSEHATSIADEDVQRTFARLSRAYEQVLRGSRERTSDFGYRSMMMFHPGYVRHHDVDWMPKFTTLLLTGAKINIERGDAARAADALAASYRLVEHLTQDIHHPRTSAIAHGLLTRTEESVARALEQGMIGPAESARILTALQRFDSADPLRISDTFVTGIAAQLEWYEQIMAEDGDLTQAERYLGLPADPTAPQLDQVNDLDLAEAARQVPQALDKAMAVINEEDPETAKKLAAELSESLQGTLLGQLFPTFLDLMPLHSRRNHYGRRILNNRVDLLESIVAGEDLELLNGAHVYLRCARLWRELDDAVKDEIRAVIAAGELPGDLAEESDSRWVRLHECLSLLEKAAEIPRCDFRAILLKSRNQRFDEHGPVSRDVVALHDVLCLRLATVEHMLVNGDVAAAIDAAIFLISNVSHVASEPTWHSSALLANLFDTRILPLLGVIEALADENTRAELRRQIERRLSLGDPFHLDASARFEASALVWSLDRLMTEIHEPDAPEWIEEDGRLLRRFEKTEARRRVFWSAIRSQPPPAIVAFRLAVQEVADPDGKAINEIDDHTLASALDEASLQEVRRALSAWIAKDSDASFATSLAGNVSHMTTIRGRALIQESIRLLE